MSTIRILIADDSVVIRQSLKRCLEQEPLFEVVTVAHNGKQALEKIQIYKPDIVILDIEMPELTGLETLEILRAQNNQTPVIMFSTLTQTGAQITFQALALGANDYMTKPSSTTGLGQAQIELDMLQGFRSRILALTQKNIKLQVRTPEPANSSEAPRPKSASNTLSHYSLPNRITAVGIGISTGGPSIIEHIVSALPDHFACPIFIVQHMPAIFTKHFSDYLNSRAKLQVIEAHDQQLIEAGKVYISPGDYHMQVKSRTSGGPVLTLNQDAPENSCRPSVDVLFRSLAQVYGRGCLGIIMTGMGQDGLKGCEALHSLGATVLAQDEASSTVWGMPGMVVKAGLASKVMTPDEITDVLLNLC